MELRVERNEFVDAVTWVTRTLGSRPTLPALAGIVLEAADGVLTCRATDLELSGEVSVRATVSGEGRALLPGKLLSQLAGRLPEAAVELAGDAERVNLRCGAATFQVRGMPVEDFPRLHEPAADAPRGAMKAGSFVRVVSQVGRAASTDEARPVLTGVKLEAGAEGLTAAATDSYRLAVRRVGWEQGPDVEALVPVRALNEAARSASEAGGEVEIAFEEGQVSFLFGDRRLTTTLVEGAFPDYTQLLPDSHETEVVVDRLALIDTLQRVSVVALGQANTPIFLSFSSDGVVELSAGNQEVGEASEALAAAVSGDEITIAFNPLFLLSGLEALDTEEVLVELRDGLKPALLRPRAEDADDVLYLLMPVRTS